MSLSRCNTPTQFYVLRFFVGMCTKAIILFWSLIFQLSLVVGLAESTFYPGMQYIIGSWYRKDELAKRSCIFHTSSGIASMFSGYLMDAVYRLGGRGGFKGWQWYETVLQHASYLDFELNTYSLKGSSSSTA